MAGKKVFKVRTGYSHRFLAKGFAEMPTIPFGKKPKIKKPRGAPTGERHPKAKLSDSECELIRQLYEERALSLRGLAKKFEVHFSTIWDIVSGRTRQLHKQGNEVGRIRRVKKAKRK